MEGRADKFGIEQRQINASTVGSGQGEEGTTQLKIAR
jgi:hypothetical protein